ncbi:MAG: hypothetical protein QOF30_1035 [Acidimicrobiaceae bacterium]|nr:hypothetical protein [Acidimicrobiaceae bacterium]
MAGPEGPEDPPTPVPDVLFDIGLELAGPLVPPAALDPVVDPPDEPDDALPVELPVEPPLDPPVEVPVAGPLSPLPDEVPVPLPDDVLVAAAGVGWGAGADDCPLFSTATSARLWISPTTGAKVGDEATSGNRRAATPSSAASEGDLRLCGRVTALDDLRTPSEPQLTTRLLRFRPPAPHPSAPTALVERPPSASAPSGPSAPSAPSARPPPRRCAPRHTAPLSSQAVLL